jgi:hypothetical protein
MLEGLAAARRRGPADPGRLPEASESTLGSILGRLLKRSDRGQFQEAMRRLYGLEL